jgi:hypothetical protein
MITRRTLLATSPLLAASLALPRSALAAPAVGAPFPHFTVRALDDHPRTERDLRGRRSLVVVMTGTGAERDMAQWLNAAEARLGRGLGNVYSFVALRMGFYVLDGMLRGESRRRSPRYRWPYLYIDRDGTFQQQLGLPDGQSVPWVYVVETSGIVSVAMHGGVSHPAAAQVWAQMAAP